MNYARLIKKIADQSGVSQKDVRAALKVMPSCLMDMQDGDSVRTPIGTYSASVTPSRLVLVYDRTQRKQIQRSSIPRFKVTVSLPSTMTLELRD